ncbi:MAG TPA: ABC transporter permease [Candidatus Merdenecus merdavium]|nr:ABC transporter permease [Candidatus Merdenecus merdavium]
MLKLYFNEIKKLKRKKLVRILCSVSIIVSIFWTVFCIRDSLPYRSLIGLTILIGNFLILPCLFSMILLLLFQVEEENGTLKNILTIPIVKWKLCALKLFTSFTFVIAYNCITMVCTTIGGSLFLKDFSFSYMGRTLLAYMSTALAVVAATIPAVLVIIVLRKRFILSMILVNCMTVIHFLFVWQVTMFNNLNLSLPILVAYRLTYPLQVISFKNFTAQMIEGVKILYYPTGIGIGILLGTLVISTGLALLIYQHQEE